MPAYLAWLAVGLAVGIGAITASHVGGAIALLAGVGGAFVVWLLVRGTGAWLGVAVAGAIPAPVLYWAALTESGCPKDGGRFPLKAGKPPVDCEQVVASYLAMAALFTVVAIVGLALPHMARKAADARARTEADERTRAEGGTDLPHSPNGGSG